MAVKPAEAVQHSIALKVMRLTKPTLKFVVPFCCEPQDLLAPVLYGGSNSYPYVQHSDRESKSLDEEHRQSHTDSLGITPFLSLPSNSGIVVLC
jgi:hypothetical protein